MPAHVHLSQETFQKAMELARPSLAAKADAIARDAQGSFNTEIPQAKIEVTRKSGTRPGGRTYEEVIAENAASQEYGTSKTTRRRIMGRVAEAHQK